MCTCAKYDVHAMLDTHGQFVCVLNIRGRQFNSPRPHCHSPPLRQRDLLHHHPHSVCIALLQKDANRSFAPAVDST